MSYDSWTCLMVENGPGVITDHLRSSLKRAACELHLKRWDKMHIIEDGLNGVISTAWTSHMVGVRSGILFRTHFDAETAQDYKVNFLLSEDDLARGAEVIKEFYESAGVSWTEGDGSIPVPELYQFYDLRGSAKKLQ